MKYYWFWKVTFIKWPFSISIHFRNWTEWQQVTLNECLQTRTALNLWFGFNVLLSPSWNSLTILNKGPSHFHFALDPANSIVGLFTSTRHCTKHFTLLNGIISHIIHLILRAELSSNSHFPFHFTNGAMEAGRLSKSTEPESCSNGVWTQLLSRQSLGISVH